MDQLCSRCSSMLLLGEGNFSFARSLSQKLPEGHVRIVATSFEKEDVVIKRNNGRENINALRKNGTFYLLFLI